MPILTAFWQGALHLNNKVNFQPLLENKELTLSSRHKQLLLHSNQDILSDIPFLCFTDSHYPIELQTIPSSTRSILSGKPFSVAKTQGCYHW